MSSDGYVLTDTWYRAWSNGGLVRIESVILLMLGLGLSGAAHAECTKTYASSAFGRDMTSALKAAGNNDLDTLASAGAQLSAGLPCTNIVPPVPALASAFRFIGVHHAIAGRPSEASGFFRTALELDPNFEWGVSALSKSPQILALFEQARAVAPSEPARLKQMVFTPPPGAKVFIDGRAPRYVEATIDRPHLLQVVQDGKAIQTELIDGTSFPQALLGSAEATTAVAASTHGGPVQVQRIRPPAKTPMLMVGGIGMVAGAGLYAASIASRSSFDSATTTEDLLKYQGTTNALVIASATTAILGLSTGYVGFILSGQPGIVLQLSH
jgi:hypothetical protein